MHYSFSHNCDIVLFGSNLEQNKDPLTITAEREAKQYKEANRLYIPMNDGIFKT